MFSHRFGLTGVAAAALVGAASAGSLTPITTGAGNFGSLAANHITQTAYVANGQAITTVDLTSFGVTGSIEGNPSGVSLVAVETRRNYLASVWPNNSVHVNNMNTGSEIASQQFAFRVDSVQFDPITGNLFVLDGDQGEIDLMDLNHGGTTVFKAGFGGFGPYHSSFDSAGERFFYTRQNLLNAIAAGPTDPSYGGLVGSWTLSSSPATAVAVDPNNQRGYVAEPAGIEVFDISGSSAPLMTIPVAGTVKKLVLDLRGNELYCVSDTAITRINTQTDNVDDTVSAGAGQVFASLYVDNVNGNVFVTDGTSKLYYYVQPAPPSGVMYRMRSFGPSPVPGQAFTNNPFVAECINDHGQASGWSALTRDSYVNDVDGVTYHVYTPYHARLRGINNNQQLVGNIIDLDGAKKVVVADLQGNLIKFPQLTGGSFILDNGDFTGWWVNPANTAGNSSGYIETFDPGTSSYATTDIPTANGNNIYWLYGLNNALEACGGEYYWDGSEWLVSPVIVKNGTMTDLGALGGTVFGTWLESINNSGQATGFGFTPDNLQHGLLYDDIDGLQDVGAYQSNTELEAINDNGVMVGEEDDPTSSYALFAVIFDPSVGSMQNLNAMTDTSTGYLSGWSKSINNAGEILINGANPDGSYNWWMLEPVANATLTNLTLSPDTVNGGSSSTGTVVLNSPAGAGGATVSLSSDNPDAQVPGSVVIPAGHLTGTFTVTTNAVTSGETATVSATYGFVSQAATLNINKATLSAVSVNSPVHAGFSTTGTVTISSIAPSGGFTVFLSSNNSAAKPDASVTVPAGQTSATYNVTTNGLQSDVTATISATDGSSTQTCQLLVRAPRITTSSISPTTVLPGQGCTWNVSLDAYTLNGGDAIGTSSSNPAVATTPNPSAVSYPQGGNAINTSPVNADTLVTFTFTLNGSSSQSTLLVKAAQLSSNALNPGSVFGGSPSTGTVLLTCATGSSGANVALTSSNPGVAKVPANLSISSGQSKGTYTVTTVAVSTTTTVTITASWKGVSKATTLTVKSPQLLSLTFQNSLGTTITSSKQGTTVKLKVSLNGPAPAGGAKVTLASTNTKVIPVPGSTTVPGGSTYVLISIKLGAVTANTSVTVTGTYNGASKSTIFTVTP